MKNIQQIVSLQSNIGSFNFSILSDASLQTIFGLMQSIAEIAITDASKNATDFTPLFNAVTAIQATNPKVSAQAAQVVTP